MDPGGDSTSSRDVTKGKQVAGLKRRRRRVPDVVMNVGDTYLGMPQTTTTTGGAGTSSSAPVAQHVTHSPFGSYGYFMGAPGYIGAPPGFTGAPRGYMGSPLGPSMPMVPPVQRPMGPSSQRPTVPSLQHPMGTQDENVSSAVGLSMPTPVIQPDEHLQDDGSYTDESDPNGETDPSLEFELGPEEVVVDPITGRRRKIIYPSGNAFYRSKTGSSAITYVLKKLYFKEFHKKLKSIEKKKRENYVKLFSTKVSWYPEDDEAVRRVFWIRMAKQLSDLLFKLRKNDVRPKYMSEEVWLKYKDFWKSPEFKEKCEKVKKNRNSDKGGSLHACGSINASEHAARLSKKAGRPLTIAELHKATHMKKDKKTYVDERARKTQEAHTEWMSELIQGS